MSATAISKEVAAAHKLIPEINAHYREFQQARKEGVKNAIKIGELLLKMKEALPHGEFTAAIEERCDFSPEWGRICMKVAGGKEVLAKIEEKPESVREAAKLIAEHSQPRTKTEPSSVLNSTTTAAATTSENQEESGEAGEDASDDPVGSACTHEWDEDGDCKKCKSPGGPKPPTFAERVKAHNLEIDRMANRIRDSLEPIPSGHELEKKLTVIKQQIQSVCGTIRTCKVHDKPCPKCEDNGKACKVCGGFGMVTKMTYDGMGGK